MQSADYIIDTEKCVRKMKKTNQISVLLFCYLYYFCMFTYCLRLYVNYYEFRNRYLEK